MPEPKIRFRYHEPDIDTNRPLVDGQVKIEGFANHAAKGLSRKVQHPL